MRVQRNIVDGEGCRMAICGGLLMIKNNIYAALGDGGNVIYVNTKKKMVVSIASLSMPRAKDRIKLIKEYIEPMFENCV